MIEFGGGLMSDDGATISTPLLSRADQADLVDYLPAGAATFVTPDLPAGDLGDMATASAVIALSPAVVAGISAWLSARGRDVTMTFRVKAPGLETEVSLQVSGASTPAQVTADLAAAGVSVDGA